MSIGGRSDRWLDRIPGYAGYRDKERRRDSDRALREQLALDYGQLAERLGRLATTLAESRQIMALPAVDKPHSRLVAFLDRLRTATYGYAPLFSETQVDAAALDQIAAFDRALGDQQPILTEQIGALEAAEPGSPEFRQRATELTATIEGLHDRFDHRGEVIQSGRPSRDKNVLDLLEPSTPMRPSIPYRLHEGEAVSYAGRDYTVIGRVAVDAPSGAMRAFQLRGGSGAEWLYAAADPSAPMYWLHKLDDPVDADAPGVTLEGRTYNRDSVVEGTGEVIGPRGAARDQAVRFVRYSAADDDEVLLVYGWGSGHLVFRGRRIEPHEIELFSRES